MRLFVPIVSLALLVSVTASAKPWQPRQPAVKPAASHQLRSPDSWPPEPEAPITVDAERFSAAVAQLCRQPADRAPGPEILAAAREAEVEPFLLAALVYHQSRCNPRFSSRSGKGLLALSPALYRANGSPRPPVHKDEWRSDRIGNPRAHLGLGARLLHMWQQTHLAVDAYFPSAAHRHAVSHFIWGDVVRSSGPEDLVLTIRRRLLAHYDAEDDEPIASPLGFHVVPPLEGSPRVATSAPGADRDGGMRRHRGLDISASEGEPVRAVAAGEVIFAGANTGRSPRKAIPPEKIARYARRRLGKGGIYLCIQHDPGPDRREVITCYMHLESYTVAKGARVTAGQTIAFVGRTGVRFSPCHLHFEVRVDRRSMNPLRYFASSLIPPKETLTYQYTRRAQRARLRAARALARSGGP